MRLNRGIVKKIKIDENADDGYVRADKDELMAMMWEITRDSWSFVRGQDAERRLQRDVTAIIRRTG